MSGFYKDLNVPTPTFQKRFIFHHVVVIIKHWSETQISTMLFFWKHLKYNNSHRETHLVSVREEPGGDEVFSGFDTGLQYTQIVPQ